MKSSRKLKIHTKFRRRTWGHTTVPEIRLEGKWLEELGFEQGKTVKVIQENKVLVLILEE
ncbi:SymE family type I addiction module toxin [Flagellimonas algicola]|uniref:Type I toxin-antitoxin system SymE family toxin n=1 Tax=Flagellimonas algicola TaxID=2583815 RepID=A0ABY2WJ29_9FLAO|nr:SymE family type I addiction module toxin [Allomuricauda algicola]TMU54848.1 type I toxin-antitoxin system SymE family toxin [Allomuricauda algicola]